jgi:hypothetical protein
MNIVLLLIISGCPSYPNANRCAKDKPKNIDLIGIWKSNDEKETIVLKKNNTCIASGTVIFNQFNETYNRNIKGKWLVDKTGRFYSLEIHWDDKIKSSGKPFSVTSLQSIDILDSPPHTLQIIQGDADECRVILLYRVTRQNISNKDIAYGGNISQGIAQASGEILIGVATGGAASYASSSSKVVRYGAYAANAWDATGNALNVGRGGYDVSQNGVTFSNSIQIIGSGLGLVGNVAPLAKNTSISRRNIQSGGFAGKGNGSNAEELYDTIRKNTTDVQEIAKNTGYKPENIQKIKDHLFYDKHVLDRFVDLGVPAETKRFEADIRMANLWNEMANGSVSNKARQLLYHEIAERKYMQIWNNQSYNKAHEAVQKLFPTPIK